MYHHIETDHFLYLLVLLSECLQMRRGSLCDDFFELPLELIH